MKSLPGIKLLIDRNLRHKAIRAEGAIQQRKIKWGPHELEVEIHGYRGKALPSAESELQQLESLATISRLANEGHLELYSSTELDLESFSASRGLQGFAGDILADVEIRKVQSAVERSFFQATVDFHKHIHGDQVGRWCEEFLLKLDAKTVDQIIEHYGSLPDFYRKNLRNVSRYQEMCRHLTSQSHYRDAFHLWTAEVNDLDYFLTGDLRFINVMTQSTKIELRSPPITPTALLAKLGIKRFDPIPLTDRRFMHLFEREPPPRLPFTRRIYNCFRHRIGKHFRFLGNKSGDQE